MSSNIDNLVAIFPSYLVCLSNSITLFEIEDKVYYQMSV